MRLANNNLPTIKNNSDRVRWVMRDWSEMAPGAEAPKIKDNARMLWGCSA